MGSPGVDVIQGNLVLSNGEPVGDAQGLSMRDPVDGEFQIAAGCLSEDDRVVCGDGLESLCQAQGVLVSRQMASARCSPDGKENGKVCRSICHTCSSTPEL